MQLYVLSIQDACLLSLRNGPWSISGSSGRSSAVLPPCRMMSRGASRPPVGEESRTPAEDVPRHAPHKSAVRGGLPRCPYQEVSGRLTLACFLPLALPS